MTRLLPSRLATTWVCLFACHAAAAQPSTDAADAQPPTESARRQTTTADGKAEIEARRLFLEGRGLLDQGRPREACEVLERSYKLAEALGTLLNLGLCNRYNGRLATAHDYYRQAEVAATLMRDSVRREFAHDEAAAIAAQRATLMLRIHSEAPETLDVRVDDVSRPRDVWARPMFVDAGEHRISVRAPNNRTWQGVVVIADGGSHVVVIPELSSDRLSAQPPASSAEPATHTDAAPAQPQADLNELAITAPSQPARPEPPLSTPRVVALAIGGTAIAALGAGLAYAIAARVTFDDSAEFCRDRPNGPDPCTARGRRLRDDAGAHATRATVFGIAGGVALVGAAAVWFLTDPPESDEHSLALSPATDGLALQWTAPL